MNLSVSASSLAGRLSAIMVVSWTLLPNACLYYPMHTKRNTSLIIVNISSVDVRVLKSTGCTGGTTLLDRFSAEAADGADSQRLSNEKEKQLATDNNLDADTLIERFKKSCRPLQLFISYAHEDSDIAEAFYNSLEALNHKSDSNIGIFFDKVSLEPGSPLPIREEIQNNLFLTDCFIMIYTGVLKKSFSYTGEEIGFFRGLMRSENGQNRKVFQIYFGEQPVTSVNELGINLDITASSLSLQRDQFKDLVVRAIENDDYQSLVQFYQVLGSYADARLSREVREKNYSISQWSDRNDDRNHYIKNNIVQDILVALYELFQRRKERESTEQCFIEFYISKEHTNLDICSNGIPPDTTLIGHGNIFRKLQVNTVTNQITWGEFKNLTGPDAVPIISSIESSAISALNTPRDDDQIIKSPENSIIYRIIVAKQIQYYDGSKKLDMYFIPALNPPLPKNTDAKITLGYINEAVEYREMFLNPKSEMCSIAFHQKFSFSVLREKVMKLYREILLIEYRRKALELNTEQARVTYYSEKEIDLERINNYSYEWGISFNKLTDTAKLIINYKGEDSVYQEKLRSDWIAVHSELSSKLNEIGSDVLVKAIENLKKYLSV